jgi:hypothetical protein
VALESSYLTQKWINDSNSRLVVYLLTGEFVGRWLATAATAVPSESSLKGKRNQHGIKNPDLKSVTEGFWEWLRYCEY